MSILPGKVVSHYRILEEIGRGGMGVVYKAEDTKLKRTVALKFLPQHLTTTEEERSRFQQEAQAAATLNHPNICTIHAIADHDGQQFIDMEYIDGTTLRAKLPIEKFPDAVAYAVQIGEALHEAHSKGIVHRDIKADNIMVNAKNQIKVMDFGLAKLRGSLKLTRSSSTVGTLVYMAPEQIQGGEVDARSDIFSFGVVLFEMLTGRAPFRGEHDAAMMYSILNEEPESLSMLRPDLPPDVDRIIKRALEKDPSDRYQHIDDLVSELRRLQKQSSRVIRMEPVQRSSDKAQQAMPVRKPRRMLWIGIAGSVMLAGLVSLWLFRAGTLTNQESQPGRKMLVVLPFENLGSPEQEYFADGITEEITSRLSGLSGLGVIARTSAMQYKKTTKLIKEIGSELGVEYVLQGTIRWGTTADSKTRVRVNAALIKVSDATQVWSQPYDAVLSDVFTMQSDIASQVANALGITLLQPERKALAASLTESSDAYDAYLRGRDYFQRSYTKQDFQIAIQMYEKAADLDPGFAAAYAKMGETNAAMYWFYYDHTKARLDAAKKAIDMALSLDPELADAHQAFGYYYYWGFLDYENALKEFGIAQKSKPNDSRLLLAIGSVQRRQGRFEVAAATMSKGFEIDPRSSEIAYNAAQTYALLRRYDEAYRYIDRALTIAPDVAQRILYKAELHWLADGDTRASKALIEQASATADMNDKILVQWYMVLNERLSGNYEDALAIFSAGLTKPFDTQFAYVPPALQIAELYRLLGKAESARVYSDSARITLVELIRTEPEDARYHSSLGLAYAGLGRKDDAVREGTRGMELLPISREAWRGARRARDMARINVMVGNYTEAIEVLKMLSSIPSEVSRVSLQIDPSWAPLRGLPEYQKLVQTMGK